MLKRKASLTATALMLLMSGVLAACGGGDNNKENASTPTSGTSKNGAAETAQLKGDFEIQYFVGGYGDAWWKSMIAGFKELHPDLNIKESAGPKINDQMKPRWIKNDPPDLVYIDGAGGLDVGQAVKDGQLMDLTEWFASAENVDGEKLSDVVITQPSAIEGKLYTVPLVFGSWGTFYDKALFSKNGWEAPKDFDSFVTVSEKIKAAGIAPYIHPGVYTGYLIGGFLFPAMVSANGDDPSILQDVSDLKPGIFKSEPVMKAVGQLVTMRDKGLIDKAAVALNHTDSQMQFLQHKDAFIPNGLWLPNEMAKDTPEGFEFGYIPSISQAPGGKYVANPYTSPMAIASKAKNPEAAKAFIQYIFTKKAAIEWAEKTGALMNLKVDLDSSKASEVSKGAIKFYSSDNLIVAPAVPIQADVNKEMENATLALTDNKIQADEWAERMEKIAEKVRSQK
ncbi:extracellular solute-binding protein [Paenibacillus sacheonensis]|uniref:Extracellular solute-binding protein n=1 Tax=Paenibacillus sacheonensis TaxID=742054 RepID=A0A7X4YLH0_9BACL|nr:extracellular solute-binding protein [Paenibacillus sacheonensis]MBM7564097.1 N-acetylglucosamine transport system substrate-binding protein [Paenibacillus sacheonensis]NBC67574.1 extracellular solute-binding protein [Paenibacillus sacheonensis]